MEANYEIQLELENINKNAIDFNFRAKFIQNNIGIFNTLTSSLIIFLLILVYEYDFHDLEEAHGDGDDVTYTNDDYQDEAGNAQYVSAHYDLKLI